MPEPIHGLHIRQAVPADLAALVRLENECFAVPWSEDALRYDLEVHTEAFYVVACVPEAGVIGYAAYWRAPGEAMITNISVSSAWRGRRVGTLLLDALIGQAMAEHLDVLTLEVRTSNQPARRLYESAGFLRVGLRRGYYEDNGEDAIIMQKYIA